MQLTQGDIDLYSGMMIRSFRFWLWEERELSLYYPMWLQERRMRSVQNSLQEILQEAENFN